MANDADAVSHSRCRPHGTTVAIKHNLCQSLERVRALRHAEGQTYLERSHLVEEAWNCFVQLNYPNAEYSVSPAKRGMTSGAGVTQNER